MDEPRPPSVHTDVPEVAAIVPPGANDAWATGSSGDLVNTDGDIEGQEPGVEGVVPVDKRPSSRSHRWSRRTWVAVIAASLVLVAAVTVPLVIANSGGTSGPAPRFNALMSYDAATGQLLMAGGDLITCNSGSDSPCASTTDSDVWNWSGHRWTKLSATITATDSISAGMVYDGATRQLLLLSYGHTWSWSGKSWIEVPGADLVATGPPPELAYDEATGQVVGVLLVPGHSANATTWTWFRDRWQQVAGADTPRLAGAVGYDAATRQLLCVSAIPTSNATWVWSGREWRSLGSGTDLPVANDRMAYDDATGQLILLQSFASLRSTVDEMLIWTGKTWSKQTPTVTPTPRVSATLGYDARTRQLLLFGGEDTSTLTTYNDTWDWTGTNWTRVD